MQISSLIGKPVLSPSGEAYGYITDVRLSRNFQKIACLVIADSEEEETYLPMQTVRAVADAVIAGKARLSEPAGVPSPIGKRAYTLKGEELGFVSDVTLGDDPYFMISKGNTTDMVPISLVSVMESVIVYESEEERALMKKTVRTKATGATQSPRERSQTKRAKREVPHRPGEEPAVDLPDVLPPLKEPDPAAPVTEPPAPKGLYDRTNLLGRYVKRPVYDNAGAPIALEGERITPALLSNARRAGKLLALAVNTLTQY